MVSTYGVMVNIIITFSLIFVSLIFLKNVNLRSRPPTDVKTLLTFFSSHTILNTLFKGLKSFRNLFYFHDRENEIKMKG